MMSVIPEPQYLGNTERVLAQTPFSTVRDGVLDYLMARARFIKVADEYPELLAGNDNLIGRIGEYLTLEHLKNKNRHVLKVKSRSQAGHDLLDGTVRISERCLQAKTRTDEEYVLLSHGTS